MKNAQFNLNYITISEHDTTRPSAPVNLRLDKKTNSSATLKWDPSSDASGIKEYRIFKNDVLAGSSQTTTAMISNLSAGLTCLFTVKAVDLAGNVSEKSNDLVFVVNSPPVAIIRSPLDNAEVLVNSALTVEVTATDNESVTKVALWLDNLKSFEKMDSPFVFSVNGLTVGRHKIKAEAFDNK
jgi:chitodextrinase